MLRVWSAKFLDVSTGNWLAVMGVSAHYSSLSNRKTSWLGWGVQIFIRCQPSRIGMIGWDDEDMTLGRAAQPPTTFALPRDAQEGEKALQFFGNMLVTWLILNLHFSMECLDPTNPWNLMADANIEIFEWPSYILLNHVKFCYQHPFSWKININNYSGLSTILEIFIEIPLDQKDLVQCPMPTQLI